ncbi:MAG TPA: hypothetical protein VFV86_01420 [Nitrososphaeraceae archaeon]|nr:hypothetical protein [Nitrososphaeraceae archaeon]
MFKKNKNRNYHDDYIFSDEEEVIIKYWLLGCTREEIAKECHISTGKASNIWDKFKNKIGHYEAEALRLLGKQLRQQNMTAENCVVGFRISKIIEKLGIPEEKIEEFLITINEISKQKDIHPETLGDALIQFAHISNKVPFSELPFYLQKINQEIKGKENIKKQLEEDIQNLEKEIAVKEEQVRTTLREANTTLFHINNFIETKTKLAKFGIVVEDIDKFTRFVEGVARHSNYDPFKVIEKVSDQEKLEKDVESKQRKNNDLETNIERLKERESEYDERLNLKSIKLKILEELEKIGFSTQELKKINMMLIGIAVEHNITNKEQIKAKFFELFEKLEDRIELENKNNLLLKTSLILENQIRINRQTLHCQEEIGPILKNLFENGITENEIVAVKALIDILSYISSSVGNNTVKKNIKYGNFANLSTTTNNNSSSSTSCNRNNNWRNEYEKVKWSLILNLILALNQIYLSNIQSDKDMIINSDFIYPSPISNYENSDSDDKKREGIADSII